MRDLNPEKVSTRRGFTRFLRAVSNMERACFLLRARGQRPVKRTAMKNSRCDDKDPEDGLSRPPVSTEKFEPVLATEERRRALLLISSALVAKNRERWLPPCRLMARSRSSNGVDHELQNNSRDIHSVKRAQEQNMSAWFWRWPRWRIRAVASTSAEANARRHAEHHHRREGRGIKYVGQDRRGDEKCRCETYESGNAQEARATAARPSTAAIRASST